MENGKKARKTTKTTILRKKRLRYNLQNKEYNHPKQEG